MTGREKALAKYIPVITKSAVLQDILQEYEATFENFELELTDANLDMRNITDGKGNIGVSGYASTPTEKLKEELGIVEEGFPFFNHYVHHGAEKLVPGSPNYDWEKFAKWKCPQSDDEAKELNFSRLEPRWHQLVGMHAVASRWTDKKNTCIADAVGIGKTMQILGLCALLRHWATMKGAPVTQNSESFRV